MVQANQKGAKLFRAIATVVITIFVVLSILPFIMIISGSLSSTPAIIKNGYSVFIQEFTLDAYRMIFRFPEEWDALVL